MVKLVLHEIRVIEIFKEILLKTYGDKAGEFVLKLEAIEELALSIDDICDGESGIEVARRLVDSLLNLLKLDGEMLKIILKDGKRIFEENAKAHMIAEELKEARTLTSILAYLIKGYRARAALAELYSKLSSIFGFAIDEFEIKNLVAAHFIIDDLRDLDKDLENGSPNFIISLNDNKIVDSQVKRILLEMVFLHFLEEVNDRTMVSDLIDTYRMYEENAFLRLEERRSEGHLSKSTTPILLNRN